jgi:hypothetical protein
LSSGAISFALAAFEAELAWILGSTAKACTAKKKQTFLGFPYEQTSAFAFEVAASFGFQE